MSLHYGSRHGKKIEWIICHYPVAPGCDATWCKKFYERTNESKSAHYAVSINETVSIVPCSLQLGIVQHPESRPIVQQTTITPSGLT